MRSALTTLILLFLCWVHILWLSVENVINVACSKVPRSNVVVVIARVAGSAPPVNIHNIFPPASSVTSVITTAPGGPPSRWTITL